MDPVLKDTLIRPDKEGNNGNVEFSYHRIRKITHIGGCNDHRELLGIFVGSLYLLALAF